MADVPWTLIANPAAGGGRVARVARVCAARLARAGRAVDLAVTEGRGHATQLARAAVAAGCPVVIACGGDGTVSEVVPALARSRTALGVLPFGTGNDLARALGIPRTPRRAVANLLGGQPRAIDLGRCGERFFATVASFGFDAEVTGLVRARPVPLPASAAYLYRALRHLGAYRPPRVRLTGDFGQVEQEVFLAATANTRSYGGGLRIAPDADPCDGWFDLCVVDGGASAGAVLRALPRVFWGGHVTSPAVRVVRSTWVRIEPLDGSHLLYADGEPLGESPLTLTVEHNALRVIRPTAPAPARGAYRVAAGRIA